MRPGAVVLSVGPAVATTGALLALAGGTLGHGAELRRVNPVTLHAEGRALGLPGDAFGLAWARNASLLAIVPKPTGGFGFPVRLIRTADLRPTALVPVGRRDVCGLTFVARTLFALASDRLCYWPGGSFSILRIDVAQRRVASVTAVPGLRLAAPTNLAFGDGRAFVAQAGGGVQAVDLRTGAVTRHEPRRALAKGEGIVWTRWLGDHLLGAGPRIVDVRTWRSRTPEPGATGIVPAGRDVAVYGSRGVAIYTRSGRFRVRVTTAPTFAGVAAAAGRLYVGAATVFDLRTKRFLPAAGTFDLLLAP